MPRPVRWISPISMLCARARCYPLPDPDPPSGPGMAECTTTRAVRSAFADPGRPASTRLNEGERAGRRLGRVASNLTPDAAARFGGQAAEQGGIGAGEPPEVPEAEAHRDVGDRAAVALGQDGAVHRT